MIDAPNRTTATEPDTAELARDVHQQCQRALRRLRTLARERDDVLLSQAMRSVNRAAQLSAAQVSEPAAR
jgi:glucose-6-phosphate-specific signal transduction histidine kinase